MGISRDLKKKRFIIILMYLIIFGKFIFYTPNAMGITTYVANSNEKFCYNETKDHMQKNQLGPITKISEFIILNPHLFFSYKIAHPLLIGNNKILEELNNTVYQTFKLTKNFLSFLFPNIKATQVFKDNGIIVVKNESNTVIYSGTDDVDAIEKALNDTTSGIIHFKKGTYNIDRTVFLKPNVAFTGDEGVIFNCCFNGIAFNTEDVGYSSSTIVLSNDAYSGDTQIKLSNASGLRLNVGDYLKISDDFGIFNEKLDFENENVKSIDGKTYFRNGEIVKIKEIDSNKITSSRPLYDDYSTVKNAKIKKISMLKNITFENIDFIGYGMGTSSAAIYLYGAQNCKISNCEFTEFGDRAVNLIDCLDCIIEGSTFQKIFLPGTGYSICLGNACDNITIKSNSFQIKGRHYIAVGGATGTKISDGLCRNVNVVNNNFEKSTDEAINTHPSTKSTFKVVNNKFFNCSKGIEFSNSNSTIINNVFINCGNGIETHGTGNHIIERNYFSENDIACISETTSIIRDNLFNNGGYILPMFNVVIDSNKFINYSTYIIYSQGTNESYMKNITILNNVCKDKLIMPIKLECCKNVSINKNMLKGYIEFRRCEDVKIIDNKISSSSNCGIRVWDAEGECAIILNEITANSRGISLENTENDPIIEKIIIRDNEIDAQTAVYNDGYSNVIIE